jgi:hypothetical protein
MNTNLKSTEFFALKDMFNSIIKDKNTEELEDVIFDLLIQHYELLKVLEANEIEVI